MTWSLSEVSLRARLGRSERTRLAADSAMSTTGSNAICHDHCNNAYPSYRILHIVWDLLSGQLVAFNRKNNLSDKVENLFKKIYSLMDVNINLNMKIKDMFPMMLVLSLACTPAAHAYYSMQLPPIHLLFALPYVPTCWSVPYVCTVQLYYGLGYVQPPPTFWAHRSLSHYYFLLILRP